MGWLDRIDEIEREEKVKVKTHVRCDNSRQNLVSTPEIPDDKNSDAYRNGTDKRGQKGLGNSDSLGATTDKRGQKVVDLASKKLQYAKELGLVSLWSWAFGYISIHDPTTGEWWDLKTADAPDWAKREAFKRKELYREGNRKAYRLTSKEMEEIREAEFLPESEGIVEDHPIEEED